MDRRRTRFSAVLIAGLLAAARVASALAAPPVATADASELRATVHSLEMAVSSVEALPVTVHHPPGYADVAQRLAARGQREVARVASALGLPVPAHVDVYLVPRRGAVQPTEWGLPSGPEWAAGITFGSPPLVVLRVADEPGAAGDEVGTVLTHELVHVVLSSALGPRHAELPAWLREGLASHEAYEWRLVHDVHAAGFALSGRFVPLADIDRAFEADARSARSAYLESFAFVNWLADAFGEAALRVLVVRFWKGEDLAPAARAAFGESIAELEARWRSGFLWRYRWIPIVTSSSTVWLVATVLFVAGGIRKRRRTARVLATWEDAEAAGSAEEDEPGPDDDGEPRGNGTSGARAAETAPGPGGEA